MGLVVNGGSWMNINNILVAGAYEENFKKQLPKTIGQNFRFVPADLITDKDLSWADAYVGSQPSRHFHFSKIKWVHSFNAGVNNFLEWNGWVENQVLLTRTICSFGQRISEYCLSYILQDLQYHHEFSKKQREKNWSKKTPKMVKDVTIVIFGTGEIGQEVARTFHHLGATVYGVSQSGKEKAYFQKVTTLSKAESLLPKADWVIGTLPLTNETKGLFNHELLNYFQGAGFINVGRGATIDDQALIDALNERKVRQAVLDVFAVEPLPIDSELWERDDVVVTPHISAVTELDEAIDCFIETLEKISNNEELPNKVDFSKGY